MMENSPDPGETEEEEDEAEGKYVNRMWSCQTGWTGKTPMHVPQSYITGVAFSL